MSRGPSGAAMNEFSHSHRVVFPSTVPNAKHTIDTNGITPSAESLNQALL